MMVIEILLEHNGDSTRSGWPPPLLFGRIPDLPEGTQIVHANML